jgi:hypothetical protein
MPIPNQDWAQHCRPVTAITANRPVVDWRSGVTPEATGFLARYAPDADPAAFADAWQRRYSSAMEEVRSGRRPFTQLDVLHRESLEAVLPEFGIGPSAVPPSELDALNLPGTGLTLARLGFRSWAAEARLRHCCPVQRQLSG